MKAVRINQWGQPLQVEEIAQPNAGEGEVLVRVRATAINPMEVFVAAGYLQNMLQTPMTPGTDFAGEVAEVGRGVSHIKPGDAVYGFVPFRGGTFAEYAVVKGGEAALKPPSLSFEQAAVVPLNGLTAWQGLFQHGQLQAGQRVLIHGVAGAVGSFAAQLAKHHGAYVIGTAAGKDEAFARSLGLDEFINYKETRFEDQVSMIDLVFATVGGEVIPRSFGVMKPTARLVTSGQMEGAEEAQRRGLSVASFMTTPSVDDLEALSQLIEGGQVKVFYTDTFPLADAQRGLEAHQQREAGRRKVVLIV